MHAVYGDADAVRWVGDGEPLSRARCEEWFAVTQRKYRNRGYGMAAMVERRSQGVIGFCGLVHPSGQPEAEIKYALRGEFWGQGFATEAAVGLLRHGAEVFALEQVIATTAPQNAASHRVLLKAGMVKTPLCLSSSGRLSMFGIEGLS